MLLTVVQLEKTCFPMTVSTLSANGAVRHPLHGPGADVWCILSTARDMTIDSRIFLTYFQLMRSGRTVKCSAQAHNTWTAVWYRATITSFVCLCECVALPLTSLSTARDFCWHEKFCYPFLPGNTNPQSILMHLKSSSCTLSRWVFFLAQERMSGSSREDFKDLRRELWGDADSPLCGLFSITSSLSVRCGTN